MSLRRSRTINNYRTVLSARVHSQGLDHPCCTIFMLGSASHADNIKKTPIFQRIEHTEIQIRIIFLEG